MKKLLFLLILCTYSFSLNLINKALEPEEAFKVSFTEQKDSLNIKLDLAENIYVYDERLEVNISSSNPKVKLFRELNFPNPVHHDGFLVYLEDLNFNIPYSLLKEKLDSNNYEIEFIFQGCSEAGLCYAPIKEKYTLSLANNIESKALKTSQKPNLSTDLLNETDSIALTLKTSNTLIILATFFGFGLLLSLTPCVFPMIPILSSIIVKASQNETMSAKKGLFLSLVYVLSMSIAYTIAGIVAGLFGANLQVALQNSYVLVFFALIFIALAFSMFGYFEIKLPSSLQSKINKTTNNKEKQGVIGIAIMGFLSALIVGPCVAPPLAGALIYIGQTGNALLGGAALFVLSLGMGAPLILIGLGAGKFMPKPGGWMQSITKIFGIVMLGVAIWLLDRVFNPLVTMYLWAFLFLGTALYLRVYKHILIQLITTLIFLFGVILFIGAVSGTTNPLNPLEKFTNTNNISNTSTLNFTKIKNIEELELSIKNSTKPILLDFWASWCISCKEFEEITFKDIEVINKLQELTLLKVDVTKNNQEDKALQKKFEVVGPPAIIFWNEDKQEVKSAKIVGYKNPKEFLEIINKHF